MPVIFQMPETPRKELSAHTIKLYKRHLNKLAAAGYDTPGKLRVYATKVIKIIKDLTTPETDTSLHTRRVYLSAVMYVMTERYVSKPNDYYLAFQTANPEAKDKYKLRLASPGFVDDAPSESS